ncbi:hypothetical protein SAMN02787142_3712 [Burkholderia sp. WP9]|uniref:hypothetical protein n=1 Tax=Burkholderia sp. WP9 TaxID=1500263 RepID=UPI000896EE22|nr:hypothetical protein [Burkholderia sp. WP9]SED73164.1 hypothetical protein SAMN02787142_3712 [Burkholderia sp. WP9]
MLRWITNWAIRHAPTPEKQAEKALNDLRMELFQAEQHVLDAQLRADYYRSRIAFCERVSKKGIEQVSDERRGHEEIVQELRPGLKLTAAQ